MLTLYYNNDIIKWTINGSRISVIGFSIIKISIFDSIFKTTQRKRASHIEAELVRESTEKVFEKCN